MKIAFAKLGRAFPMTMDKIGPNSANSDALRGLHRLARMLPEAEIVTVGFNSGERPQDVRLPSNVRNLWAEEPLKSLDRKAWIYKEGGYTPTGVLRRIDMVTPFMEAIGPELDTFTHFAVWIGQHGSAASPRIPRTDDPTKFTDPLLSFMLYAAPIYEAINVWRDGDPHGREEIWMQTDAVNYHRGRDSKWPVRHPVLSQWDYERSWKHFRYGDERTPEDCGFTDVAKTADIPGHWESKVKYVHAGMEMVPAPPPWEVPVAERPDHQIEFGVLANEGAGHNKGGKVSRLAELPRWVLQPFPAAPVHGVWGKKSIATCAALSGMSEEAVADRILTPVQYSQVLPWLGTVRSTILLPASVAWPTSKVYECFAAGTVAFMHPHYDGAHKVISPADGWIFDFLRPQTPEELKARIESLRSGGTYGQVRQRQREIYEQRYSEWEGGMREVKNRIVAVPAAAPVQ